MLLMLSLGTVSASNPGVKAQLGATITPNYKEAELGQIIQAVSEVTGKNFIIDPRVNARVTMLSATPMSAAAFYEAFLAVLQVYGYVALPAGKVIKIIPNTDARQLPSIDLPSSVSANSDEIVTQIITMKNISAAQLVPMLRPLIPQQGHLAAYPSGNILIISDRASNVSRIMKIIERMDESGDEPIEVIPLRNASATELVRTVSQLNQGTGGAEAGGAAIKMVGEAKAKKPADLSVQWLLDGGSSYGYGVTNLPGSSGSSIVSLGTAALEGTSSATTTTSSSSSTSTLSSAIPTGATYALGTYN